MVDDTAPRTTRGLVAVIAIFALGIVFGVALSFVIVHHFGRLGPMRSRHGVTAVVSRLARGLDLDAAQRDRVRAILERGHEKMRGVLDETRRESGRSFARIEQGTFDRIHPNAPPE